ncbi:MAG: hypothetical protein ACTHOG_04190, partial [Marmoricola sp.]
AVATLPTIHLSDALGVSPTDTAALATNFSALDILGGAVLLADGNHAVSIPNVWANVAGTGKTTDTQLYIQQGKSGNCGTPGNAPTTNSQLTGYLGFDQMNSPSINLGVANMKTGIGTGKFSVSIAPAQGQLLGQPPISCGLGTSASPSTFSVGVTSALSSAQLTTQLPVSGQVTIAGLGVVNLNLTVDTSISTTVLPNSSTANLSLPPNDVTPVSTGSTIQLDPTTASSVYDSVSTATVLGVPVPLTNSLLLPTLNSILAAVQSTFVVKSVYPLTYNVNSMITAPISKLLGIRIGGADVYAVNATCNRPYLAG